MSQSLVEEIQGARSRFQRIGDAKLYHGWIETSVKDVLFVSAPANLSICTGEQFLFQAHTTTATIRFVASLITGTTPENVHPAINEEIYPFRIISRMECLPPMEEIRHRIDHRPISITRGDENFMGVLVDVSATGAAIHATEKFNVNDLITLHIEEKQRDIVVEAEVKYSFASKDGTTIYRTGLKLINCSRLVSAQWRGLLDAA